MPNVIEYVVTYKTAPKEKQQEEVFALPAVAAGFAFDTEVSGGVAVITRRIKHIPHGQDYVDSAGVNKYPYMKE